MLHVAHIVLLLKHAQPANILLGDDSVESAKLGDFGLSKPLAGVSSRADYALGTPFFSAPEVLVLEDDEADARAAFTACSDIWSFGVALYVSLSGGYFPLSSKRAIKDLAKGDEASRGWRMRPLPGDVPDDLVHLVQVVSSCSLIFLPPAISCNRVLPFQAMLTPNPEDRPDAAQLLG